jgi:hypothetical protein
VKHGWSGRWFGGPPASEPRYRPRGSLSTAASIGSIFPPLSVVLVDVVVVVVVVVRFIMFVVVRILVRACSMLLDSLQCSRMFLGFLVFSSSHRCHLSTVCADVLRYVVQFCWLSVVPTTVLLSSIYLTAFLPLSPRIATYVSGLCGSMY